MIICNSRRFIFVHMMKCAGTAFEMSLSPHLRWNDIQLGNDADGEMLSKIYWRRHRLYKHAPAAQIHAVIGAGIWNLYRTVATVRCPYDRVASAWGYTTAVVEAALPRSGLPPDAGAAAALAWLDQPGRGASWPWGWPFTRVYLRHRGQPDAFSAFLRSPEVQEQEVLLRSQHALLSADGQMLVRETLRVEELAASWPGFVASIGLPGVPLVRANDTAEPWRRTARDLFRDPADIDLVNRMHADDFATFGYPMWQPSRDRENGGTGNG